MYEFTKQFESSVNLLALLDAVRIEYLEVTEERVVALVDSEVVQLESTDGTTERTQCLQIRVLDSPHSSVTDFAAFADRLTTRLDRAQGQQ